MDCSFMTTSPSALNFLPKKENNFFIPNPSDHSFETLNNFDILILIHIKIQTFIRISY